MYNKVKIFYVLILLLFSSIFIIGCTNQSFNDNIKLKDQYKEKYSNQFSTRFELLTKLSILLYNNSLENEYGDIRTLDGYKDFLNDYKNVNDKEQQKMVNNIKGFYDNYLGLVMNIGMEQIIKEKYEKGESKSIRDNTKMKENNRNMQIECKNYLDNLIVYFN